MAIHTVVVLSCILFFVNRLFSLALNFHQARKTGLRLIISPITPYTWKWQLSITVFGSRLQYFRWFRAIDWTCVWKDGYDLHEKLGHSFILVSPGLNVLCTCDPKAIEHSLRKWRDFVKPDNVNEILGTFGQNVDTSNGNDWVRHRKITAPCFSERVSDKVWHQALKESAALVEKWLGSNQKEMSSMIPDTSTLALNVVSAVAFENHEVNKPATGHSLSLRQSIITVMSTAISPSLEGVVPWVRKSRLQKLLPRQIQELLLAMQEFRQYMDETVARERRKSDVEYAKPNLIRTLIKANDTSNSNQGGSQAQLSDSELRGNIFIFTAGGLESTAITLSYSLALLAIHPKIQEWVHEEIDAVLGEEMQYTKVFPRMKRVMAIMYETLRQYDPSPPLPRTHVHVNESYNLPTSSHIADSKIGSRTITMPPGTQIMLNSWACQASPVFFPDPKTWNPKRWLDAQGELLHPTSESGFYAWGSGPRICPGMKFSQVEYTAVLSSIIRKVKVELPVDGLYVTQEWQREKEAVEHVLRDSCADPLLLHVRRPEELRLRMVKR